VRKLTSATAAMPGLVPTRKSSPSLARVSVRGKFLWAGDEKLYIRGVTYGPFHPNQGGVCYPGVEKPGEKADFAPTRVIGGGPLTGAAPVEGCV